MLQAKGICAGKHTNPRMLEEDNITRVFPEPPLTCLDTPNTFKPVAFGSGSGWPQGDTCQCPDPRSPSCWQET